MLNIIKQGLSLSIVALGFLLYLAWRIRSVSYDILFLGLLLIAVFGILHALIDIFEAIVYTANTKKRTVIDVTASQFLPSPEAWKVILAIEKLGFHRIGETSLESGSIKDTTWWLSNAKGSITAEVIQIGDLVACQFNTVFTDEAVLETSYPIGENMDKPNYRTRKNEVGIESAYQQHIAEAKVFYHGHGKPRPLPTLENHIQWDARYRELYALYRMGKARDKKIENMLPILFVFVLMAAVSIAYLLGFIPDSF